MCVHIHHISTDRASRRPAASSRVPRAWIQRGRHSQWDSNPHRYPYNHSGRQCSPLTTHVPSGVRNPFAMTACMNRGLLVKLFFQWSPLALWLHTNTHHSNAETSQPHSNSRLHSMPLPRLSTTTSSQAPNLELWSSLLASQPSTPSSAMETE